MLFRVTKARAQLRGMPRHRVGASGSRIVTTEEIPVDRHDDRVRHGQTELNKGGRLQGRLDAALSDLGVAQAYELASGVIAASFAHQEGREGMDAFIEKRDPPGRSRQQP